jgi:hypothetical protein
MATTNMAMRMSGQLASPPKPNPPIAAMGSITAADATHLICWRSAPDERRNRRMRDAIEANKAGSRQ